MYILKIKIKKIKNKNKTASYVRYKKSEDGSIQVAVTHNGKIRIKKGSNSPPSPPSPSRLKSSTSPSINNSINHPNSINNISLNNVKSNNNEITKNNIINNSSTNNISTVNNISSANSSQTTKVSNSRNSTPKPLKAKSIKNSDIKKEKKQKKSENDEIKLTETELIIDGDYSKVKPQNQIPIATFYAYCDQYFRPMTEEDIRYLQNTEDITPYMIIPPLGKHYLDTWSEEDNPYNNEYTPFKKKSSSSTVNSETNDHSNDISSSLKNNTTTPTTANNTNASQKIENNADFSPLVDRIFGCLIEEKIVDISTLVPSNSSLLNEDDQVIHDFGKIWVKPDIPVLEDRIKQELFDLGIIDDEKIDWDTKEDNEICTQMRELQRELREQVLINEKRKKKLLNISQDWIAYQQFNEVLEDQDRQIESVYNKRLKLSKKKKRPLHKPISENVLALIQKRKNILKDMATLFPPEKFSLSTYSFADDDKKKINK